MNFIIGTSKVYMEKLLSSSAVVSSKASEKFTTNVTESSKVAPFTLSGVKSDPQGTY